MTVEDIPRLILDVVVAGLYVALLAFAIRQAVVRWRSFGFHLNSSSTVFYLNFLCFLIFRIFWVVTDKVSDEDILTIPEDGAKMQTELLIANRLAENFFLCAYLNTLFFWMETVRTTLNVIFSQQAIRGELGNRFISKRTRAAIWISTLSIIAYSIVCTILVLVLGWNNKSAIRAYNANIWLFAIVFLIFSVGFLVYGYKMYLRIRNHSEGHTATLRLLQFTPIIVFVCFFWRFFTLIYSHITMGRYLPYAIYFSGYFLPEIIPSAIFLYIFSKTPIGEKKNQLSWEERYGMNASTNTINSIDSPATPLISPSTSSEAEYP